MTDRRGPLWAGYAFRFLVKTMPLRAVSSYLGPKRARSWI